MSDSMESSPVAPSKETKGLQEETSAVIKESPGKKPTLPADESCIFCFRSEDDEFKFGKFYQVEVEVQGRSVIRAHLYCLFFASGLCQNGGVTDGIQGFLAKDIMKEVNRARRLRCAFCKKIGASIGCCVKKCKQCYHFPCGRENQSLFRFYDSYESFCCKHLPQQVFSEGGVSLNTSLLNCPVCLDTVPNEPSFDVLKTPCCHNTFLHRDCIQHQALSSGFYFFRCPICNNQKEFREEMLAFGVHVPEQDASWERDEGAYQELYERHKICDVDCRCPKGREYTTLRGNWQIVLCDFCGSVGCHLYCGGLENPDQDWACPHCRTILGPDSARGLHLESTPCKDGSRARSSMKLKGKTPRSGIKKKNRKTHISPQGCNDTDSPSTSREGISDTPKPLKKKKKKKKTKSKELDKSPPVLERADLSPLRTGSQPGIVCTPKLSPITNYLQVKKITGAQKKGKGFSGNAHSKNLKKVSKSKSCLLSRKGGKLLSKGGNPLSKKGKGKLKKAQSSIPADDPKEEQQGKENENVPPAPRIVFFRTQSRLFQQGKVMKNTVDSHQRLIQRSLASVGNQVDLPLVRLCKLAFPAGSEAQEVMAQNWRRAIHHTTLAYQEELREKCLPGKGEKRRVTWSRMRMMKRSPLRSVQLQKPVKDKEVARPTRSAVSIKNLIEETLQESPSDLLHNILHNKKNVDLHRYLSHKEAELEGAREVDLDPSERKDKEKEDHSHQSGQTSESSVSKSSKSHCVPISDMSSERRGRRNTVATDLGSDGTGDKKTRDQKKLKRRVSLSRKPSNSDKGGTSYGADHPSSLPKSPCSVKSKKDPCQSPNTTLLDPAEFDTGEISGSVEPMKSKKSAEVSTKSLFVVRGVSVKSRKQLDSHSPPLARKSSKEAMDETDEESSKRLSGSGRKRKQQSDQTSATLEGIGSSGKSKKTISDYFKVSEKCPHPAVNASASVADSPRESPRRGSAGQNKSPAKPLSSKKSLAMDASADIANSTRRSPRCGSADENKSPEKALSSKRSLAMDASANVANSPRKSLRHGNAGQNESPEKALSSKRSLAMDASADIANSLKKSPRRGNSGQSKSPEKTLSPKRSSAMDASADVANSPRKSPRHGSAGRSTFLEAPSLERSLFDVNCSKKEMSVGGKSGDPVKRKEECKLVTKKETEEKVGVSVSAIKHNKMVYPLSTPSHLSPQRRQQTGQILTRLMSVEDLSTSQRNMSVMTPRTPPQKKQPATSAQYTWPIQRKEGVDPSMTTARHACSQVKRTPASDRCHSGPHDFEKQPSVSTRLSLKRKLSGVEEPSNKVDIVGEKCSSSPKTQKATCPKNPVTGRFVKKFKRDISADFLGMKGDGGQLFENPGTPEGSTVETNVDKDKGKGEGDPTAGLLGERRSREIEGTARSNQLVDNASEDTNNTDGSVAMDAPPEHSRSQKSDGNSVETGIHSTSSVKLEEGIKTRSRDRTMAETTDPDDNHRDSIFFPAHKGTQLLKSENAGIGRMFYKRHEGTPQKRVLLRRPLSLSKVVTPYRMRDQEGRKRMCVSETKMATSPEKHSSKRHLVMS